MSRHILSRSYEQLTTFDLDAFVAHAEALNQHHRDTFTTPFPKAPSRWLSHYEFAPHAIAFTSEGDVDGGLSWLVGATVDFSFTRALCAPYYGTRGGRCYDPASLIVLEAVTKVDQYVDYAQFCRDLHDSDKGRRYRQLAGLHDHVPGEDDLCHFRYRIGDAVIDQITAVAVDFLYHFGLIKGELLSTDGQLEPSYSRYKGCTYACEGCQAFTLTEAGRLALGEQLQSGAKRLQLTCPFPEVVEQVREATAKKGRSKAPMVTLLEIETVPENQASTPQRQHVAKLLGLTQDESPPLRLKWCHLSQDATGELVGSCPKSPSEGWSSDATSKPKSVSTLTPRTLTRKKRSLAISISKPPISTWNWAWNCQLATRPTPPTPMRARSLFRIVANLPSRCALDRSSWETRLTISLPTTSGSMIGAPSRSLTITGATSMSIKRL